MLSRIAAGLVLSAVLLPATPVAADAVGVAAGGRFSVNPTLVAFSPQATSALVSLQNEGDEDVRFQLSVFAWDQSSDGEMRLAPTEEIAFFPQMLTLAPGESRNVRVAALSPASGSERSFRLFVEELPRSQADRTPGVVQVLTRVGIPIFFSPAAPVRGAEIRDLSRDGGALSITLANTGNVHLLPSDVSVKALAGDGAELGERVLSAWYILPGGIRRFVVEPAALPLDRAAEVLVRARIGETLLERRLALTAEVSR